MCLRVVLEKGENGSVVRKHLNPTFKKKFLLYMKYSAPTDNIYNTNPVPNSQRTLQKKRQRVYKSKGSGCLLRDCVFYIKQGTVTMKS